MRLSLAWPSSGERSTYDYCIYQSKPFATTILKFSSNMSSPCKQFYCLHSWHRWDQHAQVKAILAFTIESVSRCFFCPLYLHHPYHHCKTWSCSDKKQELFEFCNMFINALLTFVWKYCLKWFIQMADDSDLMSFVCFVFFCAASKVIVL